VAVFVAISEMIDLVEAALRRSRKASLILRCSALMRRMFLAQSAAIRSRITERRSLFVNVGLVLDIISPRFVAPLEELLKAAYTLGYGDAEAVLAEDADPVLVEMRTRAASRISGIDSTTRGILEQIIATALSEGWAYNRLAREIRAAVREFSASRSRLIAVTEIGQAYIDGQVAAARAREGAGVRVEKQWQTVGDDRVSDGCRSNAAAGWIPLGQPFPSGHNAPLRFPGCRCAMNTRRIREA
jgi:hypothetical protein